MILVLVGSYTDGVAAEDVVDASLGSAHRLAWGRGLIVLGGFRLPHSGRHTPPYYDSGTCGRKYLPYVLPGSSIVTVKLERTERSAMSLMRMSICRFFILEMDDASLHRTRRMAQLGAGLRSWFVQSLLIHDHRSSGFGLKPAERGEARLNRAAGDRRITR